MNNHAASVIIAIALDTIADHDETLYGDAIAAYITLGPDNETVTDDVAAVIDRITNLERKLGYPY
jgi:hypothetical protein